MSLARSPVLLSDERTINTSPVVANNHTILSDMIIPAKSGEFYSYTSEFTPERPIFVFMKCKANKNRPIEQLPNLGLEANILFELGNSSLAKVYSVRAACANGLLGNLDGEKLFGETWLASLSITAEEFSKIYTRKDVGKLVETCRKACSRHEVVVGVCEGSIVAVMTDLNKYGMFLVQQITPTSIRVVACHILL